MRGVIFDLDDTLTDHRGVEAEVWSRTVARIRDDLGDLDPLELRARRNALFDAHYAELLVGRVDLDGFRRTLLSAIVEPWGRLDAAVLDACVVERNAITERARPTRGAADVLTGLRAASYRIGVLTNGESVSQRRKLAVTNLDRLLDAVAVSEELGAAKPHRRAFQLAAERLGCVPTDLVMVGDRLDIDVAGALAAGYRAAILYADALSEDLPEGAVHIAHMSEIPSCLQSVWSTVSG